MVLNQWTLVALGIAILIFLIWWQHRIRLSASERSWLPKELRDAELVYAERVFRSGGEVPIVAKCDRAYRLRKEEIVLVELKTRRWNRPYLSDVIELSAQRFAIQMQTGECVAGYGYVLIRRTNAARQSVHRVTLLSAEEVMALATRRAAIFKGNTVARYAGAKGLCRKCAFASRCRAVTDPFDEFAG